MDYTVTVIDDDFRVAGIHADIVNSTPGFRLLSSARSLGEARQLISADPPDLILVDVYLPDGDGIEFARRVGADAIVLSSAADPITVHRAFQAGALAYLIKPFSGKQLTDRLNGYLRFRQALHAGGELTQEKVDQARAALTNAVPTAAAKPARAATEQMLLDALGPAEMTATELAERTGVSRATAQRRLADLASQGSVSVRLRYGHSGRPEHLYSQTA